MPVTTKQLFVSGCILLTNTCGQREERCLSPVTVLPGFPTSGTDRAKAASHNPTDKWHCQKGSLFARCSMAIKYVCEESCISSCCLQPLSQKSNCLGCSLSECLTRQSAGKMVTFGFNFVHPGLSTTPGSRVRARYCTTRRQNT